MSKSKNNLANYHSESISKSDVSEDYEQLVKYKNLDLGKIIDWSEILNDLRRDCFMIDKSRQVNFINQFFSKSFIGNVTLCKIGEKWPIHNGEHLLPIFQLYIKDLPLIPRILSDIEYLMIFIHKEGYDASNKDSICIRSYNSNDKLVRIDRPHNIISKSYKIKLRKTNDWPSDDIPEELIDYLNKRIL
jgi:hypothetical protein